MSSMQLHVPESGIFYSDGENSRHLDVKNTLKETFEYAKEIVMTINAGVKEATQEDWGDTSRKVSVVFNATLLTVDSDMEWTAFSESYDHQVGNLAILKRACTL